MNNLKRRESSMNSSGETDYVDEAVGFDMVGNIQSNMEKKQQTEQDDIDAFVARMSRKRKRRRRDSDSSNNNALDINELKDNINSDNDDNDSNIVEKTNDLGYTSLLERLFDSLNGNNNNNNNNNNQVNGLNNMRNDRLNTRQGQQFIISKPLCYRDGSRKTRWSNFNHICLQLRREIPHVKKFVLAELSTTGNLDGDKNLSLKGKWNCGKILPIMKKYIKQYVQCGNCRSLDTTLAKSKEVKKLTILTCNSCHATRAVDSIQGGYHHVDRGARRNLN